MNRTKFFASMAGVALLALTVACGGETEVNVNANANTANLNTNLNTNVNTNTAAEANDNWNYNMTEAEYEGEKANWSKRASNLGDKIGTTAKDGWIHFKVRGALATVDDLRDSSINVDVENEVVTLRGSVANDAGKAAAEKAAKGVDGVKSVSNKLEIKKDADYGMKDNTNGANKNANR